MAVCPPTSEPRCDSVLCLVGPTASGKSAAGLALAQRGRIEIITLDSAQVYRGMNIGTAKPTESEQSDCPHHLLDLIAPTDTYSAARFAHDATQLIHEIRARGSAPVIVGGTMLYLKALREGLNALPGSFPELRTTLLVRAQNEGWPALHAELQIYDPILAERLAPRDQQRILRGLEVVLGTGTPLSSWQAGPTHGQDCTVLSLEPLDRRWLHERIAQRFARMVEAGLLSELRALQSQYPELHPDLASMRSVGYRQAWRHLSGEVSDQEWVEQGIAATRQLAKRQLTWLRSTPRQWVAADSPAAQQSVLDHAAQILGSTDPQWDR